MKLSNVLRRILAYLSEWVFVNEGWLNKHPGQPFHCRLLAKNFQMRLDLFLAFDFTFIERFSSLNWGYFLYVQKFGATKPLDYI